MSQSFKHINKNDLVTKEYLDYRLEIQLEEFKRHTTALSEDFQHKLEGFMEVILARI